MSDFNRLMNALQQTGYHRWMKSEGLPLVVGHGVEDVREIKLLPWRRTGGLGAFVHGPGAVLLGLESEGYVLMWSKDLGVRPYQNGHGEEVVELKWKAGKKI